MEKVKKEEKAKIKKTLIIDALKRCLERETYSLISMQDVADEAGISKGGMRYYFPTKESLYIELLSQFFKGIEDEYINISNIANQNKDKAVMSTLYSVEQFVLNETNIKIFINLILYGLQDEKIMIPIKEFFRNHLNLYKEIINAGRSSYDEKRNNEFDLEFMARITQVIFLSTGMLEAVDPIGMDPSTLTKFVVSLFVDPQKM